MFFSDLTHKLAHVAIISMVACGFAFAEKMSDTIQEAIYSFEMKGDVPQAISLLEECINKGDSQDKEQAYFYLGKIYELVGNDDTASLYYQQSLDLTKETAKSYWLAERIAATSSNHAALLQNHLSLKSPIKKVFTARDPYLLLQNGSIQKLDQDKIVNINLSLSPNVNILEISLQGVWYTTTEKDSLFFKPFNKSKQQKSFTISKANGVLVSQEKALVQSENAYFLVTKKGIKAEVPEKYNDCEIEGIYNPTSHFILNCPDNALHFLSAEDLTETFVINQFDAIKGTKVINDDLFFISGGNLNCFRPKNSLQPRWKIPLNKAESIISFENKIVVLEASGKISLVSKENGNILSSVRSDADQVYELAKGSLGLFTSEGALIVLDTLLHPIWNFNFAKAITLPPIKSNGNIYLSFGEKQLTGIMPHFYGKKSLLSEVLAFQVSALSEANQWDSIPPLLDSLLKLEPGNAEAWLLKAIILENKKGSEADRQKAWTEAVRLSVSNPQMISHILNHYSRTIGAKFVNLFNISPKTKYPQLFGNKKNLYTIDPAENRLICLNAETGEQKWSKQITNMESSPVISNDENVLAVASGFSLNIYNLTKDNADQSIKLPGKAFNISLSNNAVYISTWNGFMLKISRADGRMAWSRKIYSTPFLFTVSNSEIQTASLEGDQASLWEGSGQIKNNGVKISNGISQLAEIDTTIIVASNSRLYLQSKNNSENEPIQILMDSPIASIQAFEFQKTNFVLVALTNQTLYLYSTEGTPIWKYEGKNSVFSMGFVQDGEIWLDQGSEIVAISVKTGKISRKFSTPGGAGSVFVMNKTLYSVSPKRLLYGFAL